MREPFEHVLAFERAAERKIPNGKPGEASEHEVQLAMNLIHEEWEETHGAMREALQTIALWGYVDPSNLAEIADGLADLAWVTLAAAVRLGIDLPAVWEEVRKSNMSKFEGGVLRREDGKIMKGPSFKPPDIEGVLKKQRPLAEIYGNQEELAKQAAKTLAEHKLYGTERWEALYHGRTAEWMVRGYDGGGSYRTLDVADACNEARKLSGGDS